MSENQLPQNDPSQQPKDHAGLYIGVGCLVLLLLVIVFNASC